MSSTIDATPPAAPPPETTPKPSSFERIGGVIASPDSTFESIARRPDWVVPLIVWMVIALASGIIFAQKIDFGAAARMAMEDQPDMPADARERGEKIGAAMGKAFAYAAPVMVGIILLIIAAIMHLAFRLFGGEGNFRQSFSATVYAWTPNVIQSILLLIVVLTKSEVDATQLDSLLRSNLAFLVSMKENPLAYTILSSLDIFSIWALVLFSIAFSHVMRMSKGKAAGIVIPLWLVYVLLKLIPAALKTMRG